MHLTFNSLALLESKSHLTYTELGFLQMQCVLGYKSEYKLNVFLDSSTGGVGEGEGGLCMFPNILHIMDSFPSHVISELFYPNTVLRRDE